MTYRFLVFMFAWGIALAGFANISLAHDVPEARSSRQQRSNIFDYVSGRDELVLFQTLHGAAVGVELCMITGCEDYDSFESAAALGLAGGLTVSLLATRNGISTPAAQAANFGTIWGFWHGQVLNYYLDDWGEPWQRATTLLVGQSLGLLSGLTLERTLSPTPGQIAQTVSTGFWFGATTAMVLPIIDEDVPSWSMLSVLLATDVGTAVGARWLSKANMGRGRVAYVNLMGVVGGFLGGSYAVDSTDRAYFSAMLAGTATGLGFGLFTSRKWKSENRNSRIQTAMTRHNLQLTPSPTLGTSNNVEGLTLQITGTL